MTAADYRAGWVDPDDPEGRRRPWHLLRELSTGNFLVTMDPPGTAATGILQTPHPTA